MPAPKTVSAAAYAAGYRPVTLAAERVPLPKDVTKAIFAVAKALELPDTSSPETITAALAACFAAVADGSAAVIEATALRAGLSQREATMLSTTKGMTGAKVANYVETKRNTKRR